MKAARAILVVDDDRLMARTLSDVLSLHGWHPSVAHSGEEAVERVRERAFSIVLMDIKMGGMTGVDALKRIRELRPGARVVLMTAYSATQLVEEAVRSGVIEVLAKPVVLPNLLTLLDRTVSEPRPVLVVDDDPRFLESLCEGLAEAGIEATAASNLQEALHRLEDPRIGVVLLDLRLNGLVGPESVAAVREKRPGILVILFSGYPDALERTERTLPEGAIVGSLTKPFDPGNLIGLLESLGAV